MNHYLFLLWNAHLIAESLPISSSGHMRLLSSTNYYKKHLSEAISVTHEHLMHIPNMAVIGLFLLRHISTIPFSRESDLLKLCAALCITNGITGGVYLLYKKNIPQLPLYGGFLVSALALLSLMCFSPGMIQVISPFAAVVIGCAQTCALIPGISRMTLTTISAIWLGINPQLSFIFSLSCELALILVALVVAFRSKKFESMPGTFSLSQLLILIISCAISYGALEISYRAFIVGSAYTFGIYLLGISLLSFSMRNKISF